MFCFGVKYFIMKQNVCIFQRLNFKPKAEYSERRSRSESVRKEVNMWRVDGSRRLGRDCEDFCGKALILLPSPWARGIKTQLQPRTMANSPTNGQHVSWITISSASDIQTITSGALKPNQGSGHGLGVEKQGVWLEHGAGEPPGGGVRGLDGQMHHGESATWQSADWDASLILTQFSWDSFICRLRQAFFFIFFFLNHLHCNVCRSSLLTRLCVIWSQGVSGWGRWLISGGL